MNNGSGLMPLVSVNKWYHYTLANFFSRWWYTGLLVDIVEYMPIDVQNLNTNIIKEKKKSNSNRFHLLRCEYFSWFLNILRLRAKQDI